ncbi:MAG: hypothetical protein ACJ79V_23205 [Myxococcales bacterium]
MSSAGCPRCAAPRVEALDCPRCGVIYAKAEAHALAAVVDAPSWSGEADDEALEVRVRILAIPIALAGAALLVWTGPGQFLVRTFASMWVHEIGHAIAAWLCGYPAFPGPWFTPVADARSPIVAVLFAGALAYAVFRFWNTERRALAAASAGLLALQLGCTLLASTAARQFIVFAGDGGCLVLGTLLMATMYAPAESALRRGWLRWGFLVIGAVSFADAFAQWWGARSDYDRIPFGHNEGKGLSDPSVLTELFGWTTGALVRRYVVLGCLCLASLAAAYVWGLWRSSERAGVRDN